MYRLMLTLLFSNLAFAESFLISEVFANAFGKSRDDNKEWIELTNLGRPMIVHDVTLEIHEEMAGIKKPQSFSIKLKDPITFDKFLLLAQSPKLGIDACLSQEALVMPFSLKNTGSKTICAIINETIRSCASFSKKSPMPDGIALFRELSDQALEPLWRHEPCEFATGVFATPGEPARTCGKKNACHRAFSQIEKASGGPEVLSLCQSPKGSQKICQLVKVGEGDLLKPVFKLNRSFSGLISKEFLPPSENKEKWPRVRLTEEQKGRLIARFSVDEPLNLTISLGEQVVLQRAFVQTGYKTLEFFGTQAQNFTVSWASLTEQSVPLAISAETY